MRHKDPELMNRIKQYISEYYLENAGAMPEYYGAAEPPVRCGESHLSGLTEPYVDSYSA